MNLRPSLAAGLLVHLAALALGTASGCGGSEPEPKPEPHRSGKVVVLFTSDEHSHLFSFGPELDDHPAATTPGTGDLVGGVARRKTVFSRERKAASDAGKDSITVSAGDNQMGGLAHVAFQAASIDYGTMAALGYDVTTFGNHEFDFGSQALAKSITAAKAGGGLPPIVASNIHFSDTDKGDDELAAHYSTKVTDSAAIHPYRVVVTKGGLKIGVLGFVGINAAHVAPNKTPVQFSSYALAPTQEADLPLALPYLYKDLQPVVDTLRDKEKVDLVVALSHAGVNDTSTADTTKEGEDYQIASNVTGIDLIVSGHSHNEDHRPIVVKNKKGETLVLNGGAFGKEVGRVEFEIHADGSAPTWDKGTQALLPVDEAIVPDAEQANANDGLLATIEKSGIGSGSYLEGLLSRVEGAAVKDDTTKPGDLYFRPIGKTSFDLTDSPSMVFLSADTMLAAADAWGAENGNLKTEVALESAGEIRAVLMKGKTGVISAADAFDVVPLGASPVDGSIGYPLVRAYVSLLELRGVFEVALSAGLTNSDYALGAAGIKVDYDLSRPPVTSLSDLLDKTKGRVMVMTIDSDHSDGFEQFDTVIYDRVGGIGAALGLHSVVSSSYVAQFAADVGVTLKNDMNKDVKLADAILHRADNSEVKALEAFLGYIKASPGGTLSSLYDAKSPMATQRLTCLAGCP